jgi:hypothetical protein
MDRADKEASVAAWQHPGDALDAAVQEQLVSQLADALTPVLQFVAKGRLGGTMQHRAWVWLYETRRDYVSGESIDDYAKRAGISHQRVHELVKEFRSMIPAYRSPNQKSATTRARMSAAQRARVNANERTP